MPFSNTKLYSKHFPTAFRQGEFTACVPLYKPISVILFFLITGLIFLLIGASVFLVNNNCQEYSIMYSGKDSVVDCELQETCTFTFTLPQSMQAPIFFYYQLTNFHQNHREYFSSKSDSQLKGKTVSSYSDLSGCTPLISVNDSKNPEDFYSPCGLIPNSMFNDSFNVELVNKNLTLVLNKSRINWKSDKKFYIEPDEKIGEVVIEDYADPDFINWMRPSSSPNFRKLAGIIYNVKEISGNITVTVDNQFPVSEFDGTKSIVFATTSVFATPRKWGDKRFLRW
ncbi:Cell cycle control protein 50C [Entamoeba marina]